MTQALAKRETSYEDHETAYLAELRPYGVLEITTAKTMAGIAWKIEEIDHALANALKEAREAWVNRELGEWVVKKGSQNPHAYPTGGMPAFKQYAKTLKGLTMWRNIYNGEEVTIDGEQLAYAYLAVCDYTAVVLGFDHDGFDEVSFRDVYCVPNEDGTVSKFDQGHEWNRMASKFTADKIRFLSRHFEKKNQDSQTISQLLKVATFEVSDLTDKSVKWFDALKKKKEELEAKPLPLNLTLSEIEKARKLQKELTSDLWREKERLDRMRTPRVTIDHAPSLDNLFL